MKKWLDEYFDLYKKVIFDKSVYDTIINAKDMIVDCHDSGGK